MPDATQLLGEMRRGNPDAANELFPLIKHTLRRIAASWLKQERAGVSLEPTDLVDAAYAKLVTYDTDWEDRRHFFAVANKVIRHMLVDHARRTDAAKRLPPDKRQELEDHLVSATLPDFPPEDLIALDAALDRLEQEDPEAREIVEHRFFGGLTFEKIGELLGMQRDAVRRRWEHARAWLHREMTR